MPLPKIPVNQLMKWSIGPPNPASDNVATFSIGEAKMDNEGESDHDLDKDIPYVGNDWLSLNVNYNESSETSTSLSIKDVSPDKKKSRDTSHSPPTTSRRKKKKGKVLKGLWLCPFLLFTSYFMIGCWNIWGLTGWTTYKAIKDWINKYRHGLVGLLETNIACNQMREVETVINPISWQFIFNVLNFVNFYIMVCWDLTMYNAFCLLTSP